MGKKLVKLVFLLFCIFITACDDKSWNDPYPDQSATADTIYTAFDEQPKHLDPAKSYTAEEWQFIGQIYEPILEYNYLKRPYQLQPLIAKHMPEETYDKALDITTYNIKIRENIYYQPHPAFAKDKQENYIYHNLTRAQALSYKSIVDFKELGTRELKAADYAYQIKRLADPKINSPIFGFLASYIVGLQDLRDKLVIDYAKNRDLMCLDLRNYQLSGVDVIDDYNYTIKIHGEYEQFIYWLEMLFFAPVPFEAMQFYCQSGLESNNINLDTYPVGTGPFYLLENNPQRRIIMTRNPNFHPDFYPVDGNKEDIAQGLLQNAGKKLPLVNNVMFSLEKEGSPYWDKFLQGFYDRSRIGSTTFNSAMSQTGNALQLNEFLVDKGVNLSISDTLSIGYWGFNMLDKVVGGYDEKSRNLRKAIALAFDMEEFIVIFLNGRAKIATQPIPPGILGHQASRAVDYKEQLKLAQELLAKSGYPKGLDSQGKQLKIYYDVITSGDPNQRALYSWVIKQFDKLGIDLIIRSSDYNRFQDKLHNGQVQFYTLGWNADYPDPENFLFLFYGPNAQAKAGGQNYTNYINQDFDSLYSKFQNIKNENERLNLLNLMLEILKRDQPWIWGYFPQDYVLTNPWYYPTKASSVSVNTLKYAKIDPDMRAKLRVLWNKPIFWPAILVVLLLILIITPSIIGYYNSLQKTARRNK